MKTEIVLEDLTSWSRSIGGTVPTIPELEAAMRGELDEETKGRMERYSGGHLWKAETRTREVYCLYSSETWTVDEFLAEINSAISKIPTAARATAIVEYECGGYDESSKFTITFQEPETVEEFACRIGHALMYAREKQNADLEAYERLKKKYG
jgi:hypothetical protein